MRNGRMVVVAVGWLVLAIGCGGDDDDGGSQDAGTQADGAASVDSGGGPVRNMDECNGLLLPSETTLEGPSINPGPGVPVILDAGICRSTNFGPPGAACRENTSLGNCKAIANASYRVKFSRDMAGSTGQADDLGTDGSITSTTAGMLVPRAAGFPQQRLINVPLNQSVTIVASGWQTTFTFVDVSGRPGVRVTDHHKLP
ncbi:MAG: hypothetical protein IT370_20375 [Deltaproteobacteria bacterium]|nr:hypothetical protein [Deltaproteobacteria bacterium]